MPGSEFYPETSAELEKELCSTVQRFRDVLALRPKILKCFADQGVQVEGWLKGELLAFLTEEWAAGRIAGFDREVLVGVGKRKADLTIDLQVGSQQCCAWVELKHYLIGNQMGVQYNAYGYFNDRTNGIRPDIEKLLSIPSPHRYVLTLMASNPGTTDWKSGIARYNEKFHRCLRPLTEPDEFPESFFLGLIAVDEERASTITGA